MRVVALILAFAIASPALAQTPVESEAQWRSDYRNAEARKNSGRIMKWSGVGLLGTGATLAVIGAATKEIESVNVRGNIFTGTTYSVEEHPRYALIGVGSGVAVGGIIFAVVGARRLSSGQRRIDELDVLGRTRGWTLTAIPSGGRLAFNW